MTKLVCVLLALGIAGGEAIAQSAQPGKGPPPILLPKARPKPKKAIVVAPAPVAAGPTDCNYTKAARVDIGDGHAIDEDERDEKGAKPDNNAGLRALYDAERAGMTPEEKRAKFVEAVQLLLDGLDKDPYNPNINYNLAAAYAQLGRKACMLKFIKRTMGLTRRKSTQKVAQQRMDHLLIGIPKEKPPRPPDPDFDRWRDDPDFMEVTGQSQ